MFRQPPHTFRTPVKKKNAHVFGTVKLATQCCQTLSLRGFNRRTNVVTTAQCRHWPRVAVVRIDRERNYHTAGECDDICRSARYKLTLGHSQQQLWKRKKASPRNDDRVAGSGRRRELVSICQCGRAGPCSLLTGVNMIWHLWFEVLACACM